MAFQCNSWQQFYKGLCWGCGENGEGCARMGEHADSYLNHTLQPPLKTFYLTTKNDAPFCSKIFLYLFIT